MDYEEIKELTQERNVPMQEVNPSEEQALIIPAERFVPSTISYPGAAHTFTLEEMIDAWLHAKYNISQSADTRSRYERHLSVFRSALQQVGYDLDSDPVTIATIAQGWASQPYAVPEWAAAPIRASLLSRAKRLAETGLSAETYNGRIVAISSFYQYAVRHRWFPSNPMEMVERRRVTGQSFAHPIEKEDIDYRLSRIDRRSLMGLRDYAVLTLAMMTGRRANELASLRWGDLLFDGGGRVTIIWRRCKGGKVMEDKLAPGTQEILLEYLRRLYGEKLASLPKDAPLWTCLSWNKEKTPLTVEGLRTIWLRRLGTSKIHTTRHSFAVAMESIGAPLSDIGARLGHASLATTSIYLQRLHASANPFAEGLEQALGVGRKDDQAQAEMSTPFPSERAPLIRQAILDHPELSNRAIARLVGAGETTVGRLRQAMGLNRAIGTNQYSQE
jgi:integrase